MCLLVMAFGLDPDSPLVVAANRDERLDRPATAMTVLSHPGTEPRILGGRDEVAGGTWLAVNAHGLVAGLTNRPVPDGRDPSKRSRGVLPLALAGHRRAADAVEDFLGRFDPADYNPAWFLVGDRESLFSIALTDGPRPVAARLGPGLHVLENNPLLPASAKALHVRSLLGDLGHLQGDALTDKLRVLLADHSVPPGTPVATPAADAPATDPHAPDAPEPGTPATDTETTMPKVRRPETLAACVHTDDYGTRSSTLIRVPAAEDLLPEVFSADGHPCTAPFVDAGALWND